MSYTETHEEYLIDFGGTRSRGDGVLNQRLGDRKSLGSCACQVRGGPECRLLF